MSAFDRTGPMGMGPGTGKGRGQCIGFGRRHPYLRGDKQRYFGSGFVQTKADQKHDLIKYRKELEEELEAVRKEEVRFNQEE